MDKTIHTPEYMVLLELLRETRERAKLTQIQLAKELKQSQSFVSKIEIGERRLDLIQLRTICKVLGIQLSEFVTELESRLSRSERKGRRG